MFTMIKFTNKSKKYITLYLNKNKKNIILLLPFILKNTYRYKKGTDEICRFCCICIDLSSFLCNKSLPIGHSSIPLHCGRSFSHNKNIQYFEISIILIKDETNFSTNASYLLWFVWLAWFVSKTLKMESESA